MSLSKNTFNRGVGGLGRVQPSADGVSGLLMYVSSLTGTSLVSGTVYKLFGTSDLIPLGVTNQFIGETKATATNGIAVGTAGATGDVATITFTDYLGNVITLGTYTVTSTDTTATLQATGIKNAINSLTYKTGFSATSSTSNVTITAGSGYGAYLNTKSVSVSLSSGATMVTTQTAFSGGVGSKIQAIYYHVSEFFRLNPNGTLFLQVLTTESGDYATDIVNLQTNASVLGTIRQLGLFSTVAFTTGKITSIQNGCTTLEGDNYNVPLSVVSVFDVTGTAYTALTDLSSLNAKNVSLSIAQDNGAEGLRNYSMTGKTIGTVGSLLGTISSSKVSDSIGWKGTYNTTDGTELNKVCLATTGTPDITTLTPSALDSLDNYRYIFLIKGKTIAGTFWNAGNTSISLNSDYTYIENNRTIDKAVRLSNVALEPFQQSPIVLNSDGTISQLSASTIEGAIDTQLDAMLQNTEISDKSVSVPITQNVLSTGQVNITIKIVPIGVARTFVINIGFTPKLS